MKILGKAVFALFYDNVRDLCALHRTTITQLAKDLGWSSSLPTKWKNGAVPKADTVQAIAEHFGVTTDALLEPSRQSLTIGDVSGSTVLQGNRAGSIHAGGSDLSTEEKELLRVYRALDMRGRIALMQCGFDLEDKKKGGD